MIHGVLNGLGWLPGHAAQVLSVDSVRSGQKNAASIDLRDAKRQRATKSNLARWLKSRNIARKDGVSAHCATLSCCPAFELLQSALSAARDKCGNGASEQHETLAIAGHREKIGSQLADANCDSRAIAWYVHPRG